jgi:two-component system response regulator DesR
MPECPLTQRELDVLRSAEPDVPVSLIARRLHLSPGTVRNHLTAILAKLRAGIRTEAATVARDNGWL